MVIRLTAALLALCFCVSVTHALDEPKPDPDKYPQDTPEKALSTMAKVLEAEDYAYWFTWVVTPDSTRRTLEKYKTLEAAVNASKTEEPKVKGRVSTLEVIKKLQANKKTEEGVDDQTKTPFFRFLLEDKSFMQFEKQSGGRWCFNPRARTAKTPETPPAK